MGAWLVCGCDERRKMGEAGELAGRVSSGVHDIKVIVASGGFRLAKFGFGYATNGLSQTEISPYR